MFMGAYLDRIASMGRTQRAEPVTFILAALVITGAVAVAGCTTVTPATRAAVPPEMVPQASAETQGYLPAAGLPDSIALLPAPPENGTPGAGGDLAASRAGLAERGTPRWQRAASDADLSFPHAPEAFTCAVGVPITVAVAPHLVALMRRTLIDAAASTAAAKNRYQRARPFMVNGEPLCTPDEEARLRTSGSYPSGHAAVGWTWALILTELAPDRADAILQRGRAFGESRVICNVHWQSDVAEGQLVGAAVVARLHGDAAFRTDLAASRTELLHARRDATSPTPGCGVEAAFAKQ
jgi:acid phosphatase (class A)